MILSRIILLDLSLARDKLHSLDILVALLRSHSHYRHRLNWKIFMCLTSRYRLWTTDRRVGHGFQDDMAPCFTCFHILLGPCFYLLNIYPSFQTWMENLYCRYILSGLPFIFKKVLRNLCRSVSSLSTEMCFQFYGVRNQCVWLKPSYEASALQIPLVGGNKRGIRIVLTTIWCIDCMALPIWFCIYCGISY
jgi:hypothetical protein